MTAAEYITAALGKNRKNQPGVIASSTELFNTFLRIFPVFWTIAARVNRSYFGASETIAAPGAGNGWARPDQAELIYRIEDANGDRVYVVDLEEKDAEPEQPCVYEWGQEFHPAGNAADPDPATDALTFFFSKIPDTPADDATEVDALWPAEFDELIVLELALTLSIKDERDHEIGILRSDRDAWLARFLARLEHSTTGKVSARNLNKYQGSTMVPLSSLLAGGTELEL